VLVGGESSSPDSSAYRTILQARLGRGPVCVLPAASSAPTTVMETARATLDALGGAGTASTIFLTLEDAQRAQDPQIGQEIARCSGFFFTDGKPARMLDVLMPEGDTTLALRAILSRYRAGAVLAANGAAAMTMGRVTIVEGDSRDAISQGVRTEEGSEGLLLRRGIGVLPRVIVDPRFFAEGRVGRLLVSVLASDSVSLGLGVDVNTALVVDGDSARVVGGSGVVAINARNTARVEGRFGRDVRLVLAGAGDRFDLSSLAVTPAEDKTPLGRRGGRRRRPDPLGRWGFLHVIGDLAASDTAEASFTVAGATLTLYKAPDFTAMRRAGQRVEDEPPGLSAGPFTLDLLPVGG